MHFPPKFLQKRPPLLFFMVHLLHHLYGVDAPGRRCRQRCTYPLGLHEKVKFFGPQCRFPADWQHLAPVTTSRRHLKLFKSNCYRVVKHEHARKRTLLQTIISLLRYCAGGLAVGPTNIAFWSTLFTMKRTMTTRNNVLIKVTLSRQRHCRGTVKTVAWGRSAMYDIIDSLSTH